MRSGRPAYHVKAHFVSFYDIYNRSMIYFELDSKGNLKRNEKGQFSSKTNLFMTNNNAIAKPSELPQVANPSIFETEINSATNEKEKIKEESPPNEIFRTDSVDEEFSLFDDSFPLIGTDDILQDDMFSCSYFSENDSLNII